MWKMKELREAKEKSYERNMRQRKKPEKEIKHNRKYAVKISGVLFVGLWSDYKDKII